MTISKTDTGRWRARPKVGRNVIASRTFDRKADAEKWHDAQIRAYDLGQFVDPKAGKEKLGSALDRWMVARVGTVAGSTLKADKALLRMVPTSMRNLPLAAATSQQWESLFVAKLQGNMARSSVVRLRAVISSFYTWAMRQKIVASNPTKDAPVPKGTGVRQPHEVYPFTVDDLREVVGELTSAQADVALFLGLTGLRWGEMTALRVRDIVQVPRAAVRVSKSAPDGQDERATTKGGGERTVPLTAELVPIVAAWKAGKKPSDYLFTSTEGHKLNGPNWRRSTGWNKHNRGRRIHDLRHTAATFWLCSGIDPKTVQTWLGHASMTLTVDTYAHWMGSDADGEAIKKINSLLGDAGGTPAKTGSE